MSRHSSPPSSPRVCPSPIEFSPPTSPDERSPQTCPSDSDSNDSCTPLTKRAKKSSALPHRLSVQRRLRQECFDEDDDSDGNENLDLNQADSSQQIPAPQAQDSDNPFDDAGHGCAIDENLSSDSDSSSENDELRSNNSNSSHVEISDSDSDVPPDSSSEERSDQERSDSDEDQSGISEKSVENLFEGSEMCANEGLYHVLKLYIEEHWTKKSLDKDIKLKKKLLPKPNALPNSGKAALKKLEELTSSCTETEYLFCQNAECLQFVDNTEVPCAHPGDPGKFYSFPIAEQVKHMFEQRDLASAIDTYRENRNRTPDCLCDIVDGSEYIRVRQNLINPYDLVLVWNTDGVALSSSSNQELWILLCTICEISPCLRSSYVIVAGVWVHSVAPDMNVFLKPFVDSLKDLYENGVQWVHPVSKETFVSKIAAPVLVADAPAKAKVLKCKNFNHRYGCLICEQKSARIRNPDVDVENPNGRPAHIRRFLYQDDVEAAPLRSGHRMDLLGDLAEARGRSRKGVVGKSEISSIPLLDRAVCLSAEYMHLLLIGVVKYFLLLIFTKPGQWSLANKVEEIDEFIMNEIKVPDFVTRLPRKIKDLKYWKASELRSFLLYFSLPIFKKFKLPNNFYEHWLLLVGAVYSLLKEAVSINDLNSSEVMLRVFVRDIGRLYGCKYYLYNVHNLLHICLLVRRWGPLWATSAFLFETFNGFLGKNVHGTKNLGKELINNIKISQSVVILGNIVTAPGPLPFQHQVSEFLGKCCERSILSHEELNAIESCNFIGMYVLYVRASFMRTILTSEVYDNNKKRANSYVQFKRKNEGAQYGQIIVFIKASNGSHHCLVRVYNVVQLDLLLHVPSRYVVRHILPVKMSNIFLVVPLDCIITKVLKVGKYFVLRPNSYEVNL